jgi:ribosomal protein S8
LTPLTRSETSINYFKYQLRLHLSYLWDNKRGIASSDTALHLTAMPPLPGIILDTVPHKVVSQLSNASKIMLAQTRLPYTQHCLAITSILLRHGLISNITLGTTAKADPVGVNDLTYSQRRIWVSLKYRGGQPVMRGLDLISTPSQRIFMTRTELGLVLTGKRAKNVPGLGIGEILIVRTEEDRSVGRYGGKVFKDGWEAWRAGLGGEIVLRAS